MVPGTPISSHGGKRVFWAEGGCIFRKFGGEGILNLSRKSLSMRNANDARGLRVGENISAGKWKGYFIGQNSSPDIAPFHPRLGDLTQKNRIRDRPPYGGKLAVSAYMIVIILDYRQIVSAHPSRGGGTGIAFEKSSADLEKF